MPNISNNPLTAAAVFAAVAASMVFFVAVPLAADIKKTVLQIGQQRAKIAGADLKLVNAREFMVFAKNENDGLANIAGVFANDDPPLALINSLEAAAKNSEVAIEFLPSAAQDPRGGWPFVKIEANVVGEVPAILGFFEKIENSPYLIQIESANISVNGNSQNQNAPEISPAPAHAHILLTVYAKLKP